MKYEEFHRAFTVLEEKPKGDFDPGTIMLKIFDRKDHKLRAQVCATGKKDAQVKLRTLMAEIS